MTAAIQLIEVHKAFQQGDQYRPILDQVSVSIAPGEFVAVRGRSGTGKTTLLNLVAGLDSPDSGAVVLNGKDITQLSEGERTQFRRDHIGIVFQFFNLIPTLTVLENVLLPTELAAADPDESHTRAMDLLERVGLVDRRDEFPDVLSGGEQQRVAIARALVQQPDLLLADEPTGNFDRDTGERVMRMLESLSRDLGKTLLVVTHSHELAAGAERVFTIRERQLVQVGGHD